MGSVWNRFYFTKFTLFLLWNCNTANNLSSDIETISDSEVLGKMGMSIPIPSLVSESLDSILLISLENWRRVIKAGSISDGVPILDPFVVPFDIHLKVPSFLNWAFGSEYRLTLSELSFGGLSTFRIKNLNVDAISREIGFENWIGNMSVSTKYSLKYSPGNFIPISIPLSSGSAYGAIYGASLSANGQILPTHSNWFQIARLTMKFSFDNIDLRIEPILPIIEPNLQASIQQRIADEIQALKPNISQLTTLSYTKTVDLNLGNIL